MVLLDWLCQIIFGSLFYIRVLLWKNEFVLLEKETDFNKAKLQNLQSLYVNMGLQVKNLSIK